MRRGDSGEGIGVRRGDIDEGIGARACGHKGEQRG